MSVTNTAVGNNNIPRHCKLILDLLTLNVVSESRVMRVSSVPIIFFLGVSVLNLCPVYVRDRQTDMRRSSSLNVPPLNAGE